MYKPDHSDKAQSCSLYLDKKTIVSRAESTELRLDFTSLLSNSRDYWKTQKCSGENSGWVIVWGRFLKLFCFFERKLGRKATKEKGKFGHRIGKKKLLLWSHDILFFNSSAQVTWSSYLTCPLQCSREQNISSIWQSKVPRKLIHGKILLTPMQTVESHRFVRA